MIVSSIGLLRVETRQKDQREQRITNPYYGYNTHTYPSDLSLLHSYVLHSPTIHCVVCVDSSSTSLVAARSVSSSQSVRRYPSHHHSASKRCATWWGQLTLSPFSRASLSDFTASNGSPKDPASLHYLDPSGVRRPSATLPTNPPTHHSFVHYRHPHRGSKTSTWRPSHQWDRSYPTTTATSDIRYSTRSARTPKQRWHNVRVLVSPLIIGWLIGTTGLRIRREEEGRGQGGSGPPLLRAQRQRKRRTPNNFTFRSRAGMWPRYFTSPPLTLLFSLSFWPARGAGHRWRAPGLRKGVRALDSVRSYQFC